MKRANLTYILGLLLGEVVLCSSQEVTIFPSSGPNITVPSISYDLQPGIPLFCGLEPVTLTPGSNYTTRWILPAGEIVNSSRGRFILTEALVSINDRNVPGTVLIVTELSYQDAGMYTCEGRSTGSGASTQWATASFKLQLNLKLLSNTSTVMVTMNDSTIALYCEMRAFIRPDSFLIWEGPSGQRITSGTGKYQIAFSDGSPGAAANGGGVLVPSRVSTLAITNPEPSDAGTYSCSVMGTNQTVIIDVRVNGSEEIETTDLSNNNSNLQLTGIILGSIAAILIGLLVIATIATYYLVHKRGKSKAVSNTDTESNPVYDYITLSRIDRGVQHHKGKPDKSTSTRYDDMASSVIKHDTNLETNNVYEEINIKERDDTYDTIEDVLNNTTIEKTNEVTIDSEMNVTYEVPMDGIQKTQAIGVARNEHGLWCSHDSIR